MNILSVLWGQVGFKDLIDILVVAFIIYQMFVIIHGTRAVQVLVGLGVLFGLFWVAISFKLYALNWILAHFFDSFFVIAIILFQEQIRSALASVGGRGVFSFLERGDDAFDLEEVVEACGALGRENVGALIVLERSNGLVNYTNTGTKVHANAHSDLIYAIFQSSSPLHDGAIIISEGKLEAAGCFLPLSKNVEIDRHLGTRHRAALGITEITDAVVITVSEETGRINLCINGEFYFCENESVLRQYLKHLWKHDNLDEHLSPIQQEGGV